VGLSRYLHLGLGMVAAPAKLILESFSMLRVGVGLATALVMAFENFILAGRGRGLVKP
jgi:hypothetical protein